jgi:magnesium transporter
MLHIYSHDGQNLVASTTDGRAGREGLDQGIWYDLNSPTRDEERFVEQCLGIAVPTRDEMKDIEPSARLYSEAGAEFLTLTVLSNLQAHDPVKSPVTFILRDQVLVTLRYSEPTPFAAFAATATRPGTRNYATGEMVMVGLVEALIDRLATVLERTGDELDAISRGVFRSAKGASRNLEALIEKIGNKGDLLTLVRESLVSIQRLASFHQVPAPAGGSAGRDMRQELKVLQRDAQAPGDHAGFLSNKVNFLLDATLGLINLEQNQIIKIFSVAAVVFLPPTLVASIYGMNFEVMPELGWQVGYPMALGLMVASAILPYLFFKRRGWL